MLSISMPSHAPFYAYQPQYLDSIVDDIHNMASPDQSDISSLSLAPPLLMYLMAHTKINGSQIVNSNPHPHTLSTTITPHVLACPLGIILSLPSHSSSDLSPCRSGMVIPPIAMLTMLFQNSNISLSSHSLAICLLSPSLSIPSAHNHSHIDADAKSSSIYASVSSPILSSPIIAPLMAPPQSPSFSILANEHSHAEDSCALLSTYAPSFPLSDILSIYTSAMHSSARSLSSFLSTTMMVYPPSISQMIGAI